MDEQDKQVPENEIQEEAPPIDPPSKDIDREQEADAKNDVETTGVSKRTSDEDKLMPLGLKIAIGVGIVVLFIALFFKSHLICFHSDISPASCTNPPICKTCGKEMGEPSGHSWRDATCTDPKTCKMCGKTEGEALGHKTGEWTVSKPATCTEKGEESSECSVCKSTITREPADGGAYAWRMDGVGRAGT